MICPACGHANEDGTFFCDVCKADLAMPAPSPQGSTPMSDQVSAPAAASSPAPEGDPIPLEPIMLEPMAESTPPTRDDAIAETSGQSSPAGSEPVTEPPTQLPEPANPPPLPARTDEPSTGPYPAGPVDSPKLVVIRGQRMDVQFPIYPGKNYIGRTDDKPVDIDLEDQEAQDRIWASRQHAVITFEDGKLTIEDLNSLNGTFVNRNRVHPGQLKEINVNDVIQIGTVHLKVIAG
jgi:FHA domain-containing protein